MFRKMLCAENVTITLTGFFLTLMLAFAITTPVSAQQTAPTVAAAQPASADDFQAAMHLYRQRRFGEAIESFQRITQSDPNNAAAWYFLGYARYVTKHPSEALDAFSQAFQKDPSFDPRPYFRKGKR